jgi:hypothetical protein
METTGGRPRPDAQEASSALREARRTEAAVHGVQTPWWYFVLSAALFAALILAQLLEGRATTYMMAAGTSIVALNMVAARRAGVFGATSRNRGFVTSLALILVVIVGSIVWYRTTDEAWTVAVSAGAAAVLMLIGGWLYRRDPS